MTLIRRDIVTSVIAVLAFTLLLGIVYPLLVTGVSQVAFPGNANGQLVYRHGQLVGSKLIGQHVTDPHYFQTRPSATVPPDNAAATTFSNLGPNDLATKLAIQTNVQAYIQLNGHYYPGGLTVGKVPVDAANTSASGIDPDVSVANADIQAYRVAAVDHIPLSTVRRLIATYTGGRGLGFSGEPTVNVLQLNLAIASRAHLPV